MTPADAASLSDPWGPHPLPADDVRTVRIGPLLLRLRRREGEIHLTHHPGDGTRGGRREDPGDGGLAADRPGPAGQRGTGTAEPPGPDPEGPAPGEEWVRWPVSGQATGVTVSPAFCERPVVVEPEQSFRLLPRTRARIFVRVPLWARVTVGSAEGTVLTEVPTLLLSDTWWGGFTEGELCYWLPTSARRRVEPGAFAPHLATCPLELANRSDEELQVERIALRTAHLSVYRQDGRFWADETRVRYRGPDEESEIEMSGGPPPEEPGAIRVTPPRRPIPRGFRARSFARLKALPGLGGL